MTKRTVIKKRKTKETDITVKLNIDGTGKSKIKTNIELLDHMLELFAFWGLFDLDINAKGDLMHHTGEDVGLVLGQAFKEALVNKKGIRRIGSASVPMENILATVIVDVSGRGYFEKIHSDMAFSEGGQNLPSLATHVFETFAKNLGMNLYIILRGTNPEFHTCIEPIFKALGIALDQATQIDPRRKGVPSTKGVID